MFNILSRKLWSIEGQRFSKEHLRLVSGLGVEQERVRTLETLNKAYGDAKESNSQPHFMDIVPLWGLKRIYNAAEASEAFQVSLKSLEKARERLKDLESELSDYQQVQSDLLTADKEAGAVFQELLLAGKSRGTQDYLTAREGMQKLAEGMKGGLTGAGTDHKNCLEGIQR